MRERPILFSSPMISALLSGAKTQTRRVVKRVPDANGTSFTPGELLGVGDWWSTCPYGVPGDRLWVRETWGFTAQVTTDAHPRFMREQDTSFLVYRADVPAQDAATERTLSRLSAAPWRPSIHMPRWASRITLEVTDVRVERLQSISEEDARAEGVAPMTGEDCWSDGTCRTAFEYLWGQLNGFEGESRVRATWARNPWVWVVSFRRLT